MGYQLPEKSKVIDTVRKKKVLTHIEPVKDVLDANGNLIEKGNLVRISCEPYCVRRNMVGRLMIEE